MAVGVHRAARGSAPQRREAGAGGQNDYARRCAPAGARRGARFRILHGPDVSAGVPWRGVSRIARILEPVPASGLFGGVHSVQQRPAVGTAAGFSDRLDAFARQPGGMGPAGGGARTAGWFAAGLRRRRKENLSHYLQGLIAAALAGPVAAAPFSHAVHLQLKLSCVACHAAALTSASADDNLLPSERV